MTKAYQARFITRLDLGLEVHADREKKLQIENPTIVDYSVRDEVACGLSVLP